MVLAVTDAVFGKRQRHLPQNRQVAERTVIPRLELLDLALHALQLPRLLPTCADHCERNRQNLNLLDEKHSADNQHDARGHRANRPQTARGIFRGKLLEHRRLGRQKFKHRRLLHQRTRRRG